ncbi:lysoplasmalogenase [Temperatibacter marinus]|uniref:Lysoplasmalogenase n=1 Tax=Temperatibacter marinus TaxID=1456591 RepID=A0AA52EJY8_9PROT|nr:lysoplasmalogenase [Temperatibacter marinus]WND03416.1 lysoplasmalogenase [Temperatibacter marinus]
MTRIFTKKKRPILEFFGSIILILSIIAAVVYELKSFPDTLTWSLVAKGLPVALLGVYALFNFRTLDHAILALALFASAAGDIGLELPFDNKLSYGIAGFSVAHVFYMLLFLRNRRHLQDLAKIRLNIASLAWALTTIVAILLYDSLGEMQYLIIGYMVILTGMVSCAQLSRYPFILVGIGSMLFFISDAFIAGRMFLSLPDWSNTVIWLSYYLAQFLITMGVLIAPDQEKRYHIKTFT